MEDSLRVMLETNIRQYCATIKSYCPSKVTVVSNSVAEVVGKKYPMFTVDLKFVEATPTSDAMFIYSTKIEGFLDAILQPILNAFNVVKNIAKVEYRVMRQLFWPNIPLMRVPYPDFPWVDPDPKSEIYWVIEEYETLKQAVSAALVPLTEYLNTLHLFKDLISIDIKTYSQEAEVKYCSGDNMNLPELCNLAYKHSQDSEEVVHQLPSTINLGLVLVDCRSVKTMLSAKHKAIAASLFKVLEMRIRDYAESIISEFRDMYNRLVVIPNSIEGIVELREFMTQLPGAIELLSDRIQRNEGHFSLIETAKWQIGFEVYSSVYY